MSRQLEPPSTQAPTSARDSTPNSKNMNAKPRPKKLTVDPLPRYPDIVLALNLISTDPARFHWYFFVPKPCTNSDQTCTDADADADVEVQSGYKLHATTDYNQLARANSNRPIAKDDRKRWSFDASTVALGHSEGGLAAAAVVGRLAKGSKPTPDREPEPEDVRDVLAQIPMGVVPEADKAREPEFTCRVWVREALRRMHAEGFVDCPDVDALEEEMWGYGRRAAVAIDADEFVTATLYTAVHSRAP